MASRMELGEMVGDKVFYDLLHGKEFFHYVTNESELSEGITLSDINANHLSLAVPGCRYIYDDIKSYLTADNRFIMIHPVEQFSRIDNDWYVVTEPRIGSIGTFSPREGRYISFITGKNHSISFSRVTVEYLHGREKYGFVMRDAVKIEKHEDLSKITMIVKKDIEAVKLTMHRPRRSDIVRQFDKKLYAFAQRAKDEVERER
jgi:hypothetical protein